MLENMTRKEFSDFVRQHLNLKPEEEVSSDHLAAIEEEAWQIVEKGKYVDPIAVEILEMLEKFRDTLE